MRTNIAWIPFVREEQEVADVECGTPSLGKRRTVPEVVMVHLMSVKSHLSNFVQRYDLQLNNNSK